MQIARETEPYIGTPVLEDLPRPVPEDRFLFRYLTNGRVETRHPFHGTLLLGDRSAFPDPAVDDLMVQVFEMFPYMLDSMKLNRTRRFETHRFAGEYSQLSHGFSLACIARAMAGGPLDMIEAMTNDLPHTHGGHGDEDIFQPHGEENIHDLTRKGLFERSGFLQRAIDNGIFTGPNLMLGGTRLACGNFLDEQTMSARRSFLNNDHVARRLDADRFQYNDEEDFLTRSISRGDTDASLGFVARYTVPEDGEGEQLVYTDTDTALSSSIRYMRKNAEHWMEPVQDLISDATNLLKMYLFVCDNPTARMYFQDFYPRDYLYSSASRFYEIVDQIAAEDPVVDWLVAKIESWGAQQRDVMDNYSESNVYEGPIAPDEVTLTKLQQKTNQAHVEVIGRELCFVLPPGKLRAIDPRVLDQANNKTEPISVRKKAEFEFYKQHYSRWIGTYSARVEIEDETTAQLLAVAVDMVQKRWEMALERQPMTDQELQAQIRESNEYVKKLGAVVLQAV